MTNNEYYIYVFHFFFHNHNFTTQFKNIYHNANSVSISFQPDITVGAIIPAARGNPLQPEEWCAYFDINGAVSNLDELKEKIFKGVRF